MGPVSTLSASLAGSCVNSGRTSGKQRSVTCGTVGWIRLQWIRMILDTAARWRRQPKRRCGREPCEGARTFGQARARGSANGRSSPRFVRRAGAMAAEVRPGRLRRIPRHCWPRAPGLRPGCRRQPTPAPVAPPARIFVRPGNIRPMTARRNLAKLLPRQAESCSF